MTGAASAAWRASCKPIASAAAPRHGLETPTTSGSRSDPSPSAFSRRLRESASSTPRAGTSATASSSRWSTSTPGIARTRLARKRSSAVARSSSFASRQPIATRASLGCAKSHPSRRARDDRPSAKRPAARSAKKSLIRLRSSRPSIRRIFLMPTAICEAIEAARSRSSGEKRRPSAVCTTRAPSTSPSASIGTSSAPGSAVAPHSAAPSVAWTALVFPVRRDSASSLTVTADGASPTSGAEACRCRRSPRSSK